MIENAVSPQQSPPPAATTQITLRIDRFVPVEGAEGTQVEIQGQGFAGVSRISFGSVAAPFLVNSPQSITAFVPPGLQPQTLSITVTGTGGTASAAGFQVLAPGGFQVSAFNPDRGASGTVVSVFGAGLSQVTAARFVGARGPLSTASISHVSDAQLDVHAPPLGAGVGPITLQRGLQSLASKGDFVGSTGGGQIAIDSFDPRLGPPGTQVAIHGVNILGNVEQVQFNGFPAGVVGYDPQDPGTYIATVPECGLGPAFITVKPLLFGVPVTTGRAFIVTRS